MLKFKFQEMEFKLMILTKFYINNWYSFVDCELDLTYPRKINDSTINFEYLKDFENIRFKRVVILTGANASGKTSFAKIILAIRNFIRDKKISKFFSEGMHESKKNIEFSVEFIDKFPENLSKIDNVQNTKYNYIHSLSVKVFSLNDQTDELRYAFTYKAIELKKTDNIIKVRNLLDSINNKEKIKHRNSIYISNLSEVFLSENFQKALFDFTDLSFNVGWSFLYNDLSEEKNFNLPFDIDKEILESVLKTFDPSIKSVNEAYEKGEDKTNGYFINFHNNDKIYLSNDGEINRDKKHLLSLGTYESIKIASFISAVLYSKKLNGCTFFLDEGMSHVQSEIERAIVALIVEKMNQYSQFFYTTHNYDILDMNLPIHSFLFVKKDEFYNSFFIKAESHFNKNDRSIINFIKNDVFGTLPDISLIDDIMMRD